MVLTVILDLGGVYFTDGTKIAIEKICERYSVDKEKATYALDGELGSDYRTGALSHDEFWKKPQHTWRSTPLLKCLRAYGIHAIRLINRLKSW